MTPHLPTRFSEKLGFSALAVATLFGTIYALRNDLVWLAAALVFVCYLLSFLVSRDLNSQYRTVVDELSSERHEREDAERRLQHLSSGIIADLANRVEAASFEQVLASLEKKIHLLERMSRLNRSGNSEFAVRQVEYDFGRLYIATELHSADLIREEDEYLLVRDINGASSSIAVVILNHPPSSTQAAIFWEVKRVINQEAIRDLQGVASIGAKFDDVKNLRVRASLDLQELGEFDFAAIGKFLAMMREASRE